MKYTKKDLKEGMKLRVIDGAGFDFWEEGSVHEVIKRNGTLIIDYGDTLGRGIRNSDDILGYLNLEYPVKMEVVEEGIMKSTGERLTEDNIKEGLKVVCVKNAFEPHKYFTVGKEYEVVRNKCGYLGIEDDDDGGFIWDSAIFNEDRFVFEILEEPSKKAALKALDNKIRELNNHQQELFQKRDRINEQAILLGSKARRLEEAKALIEKYI
ncbi:putative cytidine deaminase [Enterococcus phage Entf1]|nr:putative cytidine deaminase [Enterococcus phage Entf1]